MYDHIVIGAGVEGSATAYQLTKRGENVLLLEQFCLPHTRGSSHGATRITRKTYTASFYTKMMVEAFAEWEALERLSGTQLYVNNGLVGMWPAHSKEYHDYVRSLVENNFAHETFGGDEANKRFPGRFNYPAEWKGIYDPAGGILKADKALLAYWAQIKLNGGRIVDEQKVIDIKPNLNHVTVSTATNNYQAKNVIVCVGTWAKVMTSRLGLNLPLQPQLIKVCFWKDKQPGKYSIQQNMPCLVSNDLFDDHFFGMPAPESAGWFKLCLHHGEEINPDERDLKSGQWQVDRAQRYVKTYLPGLEEAPVIVENCMYTVTPDGNFILGRHPYFKNVIIGAGFSGHGFKLSPVVGNILADLAMNKSPKHDLQPFSINRFGSFLKSNV